MHSVPWQGSRQPSQNCSERLSLACIYLGTGVAFGRKCFLAYSPGINRVFATVECQFDETYYPYRPAGHRRYYGIHDNRDDDFLVHTDADFDDLHVIHKLQSMPLDNPAWDPCHDLTDPFERQYEDAIARPLTTSMPLLATRTSPPTRRRLIPR